MLGATLSIYATRVGATGTTPFAPWSTLFQPTRPLWEATRRRSLLMSPGTVFIPRAPCGARLSASPLARLCRQFQSTRPVWGATRTMARTHRMTKFQSTRPVWGATPTRPARCAGWRCFNPRAPLAAPGGAVSIHAPRVGATLLFSDRVDHSDVSIHAPRVGRDLNHPLARKRHGVSIHAPRVGRDSSFVHTYSFPKVFQSTRPVWGATMCR